MRAFNSLSAIVTLVGVFGFAAASNLWAQPYATTNGYSGGYSGYGAYPFFGNGGMTAAMGSGIGYGQALAGQGAYQRSTAEAAEIQDRAAREYLQNHDIAVNQFYKTRQLRQQMANTAERPLSKNDRDNIAAAAAPHRLVATQFERAHNVIIWPYELRTSPFEKLRYKIDRLFDERTPQNSGEASSNYTATVNACQELEKTLNTQIDHLAPMAFIQAQQFIKSVAYEASFSMKP